MFYEPVGMEVDPPSVNMSTSSAGDLHTHDGGGDMHSSSGCGGTLKRSNSAPMINVLVSSGHSEPQIR